LIEAVQVVLGRFAIDSMMTYGGEPLLYPTITAKLHRIGQSHNLRSQELITNGFFSKNIKKIQEVADELLHSGVSRILVSVDSFHQERIPIEFVELFIDSVLKTGFQNILLHPAWLISRNSDNEYNIKTKEILDALKSKLHVSVSNGNIISPAGLSRDNLRPYYEDKELDLNLRCGDIPYTNPLTKITKFRFLPNGNVNICRGLCIGNIFENSMESILEQYDPFLDELTSMILNGGIKQLSEYLIANNVNIDASQYYGLCDYCSDCIKAISKMKGSQHV
jgi:MoaA/NifB/PqqE/SkfB family radical SAM enzyme